MQIEITRVILYVRDVARLKVFYETHFGFRTIEEIEGEWVVLLAGRVELALHLVGKTVSGASDISRLIQCQAGIHGQF
jgi:catechol-2,3-dioxygenase